MNIRSVSRWLAASAALAAGAQAPAADIIKAATGTDLAAGASWGGSPPTAGDTAVWTGTSLGAGLTLDSVASWGGIRIDGALGNISISGLGGLTLGAGGIDAAGSGIGLTITNNLAVGAAQTWETDSFLTVYGAISGTDPLTVTGIPETTLTWPAYLTETATVIFPNATLADFTRAQGAVDGAYVNGTNVPSQGYKFANDGTTATFQLRILDGGYTKCVKVELQQSGADITGRAVYAKYISGANLGYDFDTGGNAGTIATSASSPGYGAASITIGSVSSVVTLGGFSSHSGGMTFNGGLVGGGNGVAFDQSQGGSFGTGDVTLNPGTRLTTTGARVLGGGNATTRTVTINGATANIEAAGSGGEYFRTLSLTGGTLTADTTAPYFRAPTGGCDIASLASAEASLITTGIDLTFSSLTVDVADGAAVNDLQIGGSITQNTGAGSGDKSLAKNGAGTLVLAGLNSFTGGVAVNAGTLKLGSTRALGAYLAGRPVTQVTVAAGAAVDFDGMGDNTYGYTITGTGAGGAGALTNGGVAIGNNLAQCSNIALTDDAAVGGSGNWSLLTNGYGATALDLQGHTLAKVGGNTIGLVSTTVTAGTIEVAQGTLSLGVSAGGTGVAAPDTAVVVADSAGAGLAVFRDSSIGSLAGGGAGGGNLFLNSGTLTVGALGTDTIYGGVIGGGGDLVKTGAGTLTLTADQTCTGTITVLAGNLELGGALAGPLVVQGEASLAPGGAAIATLDLTGDVTLRGTTTCQIGKSGATLSQDTINTSGVVTYGGALEITATGDTLALGDTFQLFGGAAYQGGFSSYVLPLLPAGLSWDLAGLSIDGTIKVSDVVMTPYFTPASGAYAGNLVVTITSDPGATIHYTTDGSQPTTSSDVYTGPVAVPADAAGYTIRALATRAGQADSLVGSATYDNAVVPSWNVDFYGDWSDPTNWLNGVIPDQAGVTADFTFYQSADTAVTLDSDRTVGGLVFGNANLINWELAATPGSVLTLATGSGTPEIAVTGQVATISAPLAGTQGFTKTGPATLVLTSPNNYSGDTAVAAGQLAVGNNTALGGSSVILGATDDPVAFYLAQRADISNPVTVSAAGTGTVVIGADNSGSGQDAASFLGPLTLNRPTTISGEVTDDRLAIDGRISGNVGTLTVTGGARTTFFSTENDFTGDLVVTGDGTILQAAVATAGEVIPDGSSVTVDAGAVLQLAPLPAGPETIAALNGAGTVRTYPTGAYPGTLVVGSGDASGSFDGQLMDGAGALSLAKIGAGTQTFGGPLTHSGNTTVNEGTLVLADTSSIRFRLTNTTSNQLNGTGAVTLDGTFAIDAAALTVTTGSWTVVDTAALTETYGPDFLAGGGWAEAGAGVWEMTDAVGVWTYTGATGVLSLAEGDDYWAWIDGFFPGETDPAIIGTDADPDDDGIANSVEMVIGGNPATGMDTALLPTIELVTDPAGLPPGNWVLFTYRRTDQAVAAGVTVVGEYGVDLVNWAAAQNGVDGVVILEDDDYAGFDPPATVPTDRVRVYAPQVLQTLFGRLKVTVP